MPLVSNLGRFGPGSFRPGSFRPIFGVGHFYGVPLGSKVYYQGDTLII